MVPGYKAVLTAACWWAAWAAVIAAGADDRRSRVTKCCPRDQMLKIDLMTCVGYADGDQSQRDTYDYVPLAVHGHGVTDTVNATDVTVTDDPPVVSVADGNLPWWVPDRLEFLRAANVSEKFVPDDGLFDAEGRLPCDVDDRDPIIIDGDVAVLDDGRLIMFEQETRPTTAAAGSVGRPPLTFAGHEYCVDRVSLSDTLVAFRDGAKRRGGRAAAAAAPTNAHNNGTVTRPQQASPSYAHLLLVCRPCSRMTCVPKCCNQNHVLEYKKNQYTGCHKAQSVAEAHAAIRLKASNGTELKRKDYYFYGLRVPDCDGRGVYLLNESGSDGAADYWLMADGRVSVVGGVPIKRDEYCVDALNVVPDSATPPSPQSPPPPTYRHVMLACRQPAAEAPLNFRDMLYGAYFVVGAAFLAATLLIYVVLPELRVTVHSGNLIAHTACLFVSYATLAATTLAPRAFHRSVCVVAAFVIQFTFLAAFFWLNVMCADIAWTFSGFRLLSYTNTIEHEKKKYIVYSVYAWGCSVAITILTALAEFTKLFDDDKYTPNFGQSTGCWFSSKFSVGVFFYLPIGLLLLTNFILFLFTAFRIISTHADTSRVLNRQTNQNNMRLSLYLKLFCLMGVTFVFEVISWAVEAPPHYWYVTDAVNSLRGVFVFFIFCWKRSVLNHLLARAPKPARDRFVRTFRLTDPNACPSFSSTQPGGHFAASTAHNSMRTHSTSLSSSFQLSQFGSNASVHQQTAAAATTKPRHASFGQ